MPRWLAVRYLRMLIGSADHDMRRYMDDERHAQRQQVAVYWRRAELTALLRALVD